MSGERELLLRMHGDAVQNGDWEGARDLAAAISSLVDAESQTP